LPSRPVERPWGRDRLPPPFTGLAGDGRRIGEIWFEDDATPAPDLLVKYLFTSERLSIQVHPDDAAARAAGYGSGKDEAWLVIDADPDATIGLGLTERTAPEVLRTAALDGRIEQLVDWRPVKAGDFIYSPAGTIHAIGGGVSLIEIQQNSDVTYRLYDYGRPRPLHLDQALAVAQAEPFSPGVGPRDLGGGRRLLASGGAFVVECWRAGGRIVADREVTLIPLAESTLDGVVAEPGSVWSVRGEARLEGGEVLIAYLGGGVQTGLRAP